jgi:hypothetical protein
MPDLKININGTEVIVPEVQVTEAVTKGELEIKADTLKVMPVADFDQLTANLKNEEYNKGKVAGVEMSVKEQRESLGLQFDGKTIPNLLDAFKNKILTEAKIEPNKQIEDLQKDKEKLQGTITDWQTKYTGLEQTIQQKDVENNKFTALLSVIPTDGLIFDRMKVARDIKLDLEEKGFKLDIEAGKTVIKQNGEIVKDEVRNPITLEKFLPDFVKPYQKVNSGGAGGSDKNNNTPGSLDAFTKEMETAGHRIGSVKYNEEMNKRIKDKTLTL